MTEMIFEFLAKYGFTHPVHPALTHIPMGMAMGAVTFRLISFLPKLKQLATTGYHCVILGFLGIFPTVFTGYLDWQHTFDGEWEFLIILKMILAALLAVVMGGIIILDEPDPLKIEKTATPGEAEYKARQKAVKSRHNKVTILYLLIVLIAVGLGFSGGELQYG